MASESKRKNATSGNAETPARRKPPARKRGRLADMLAMDTERQARLLLVGSVTAALLVVAGIIFAGWYYTEYRPRYRTVLKVGDTKISYEAMKRRMSFEYFQTNAYQNDPRPLPEAAYQALVRELTVVGSAETALGVIASDQELADQLRTRAGVAPEADDKTFGDGYRRTLAASGLQDKEFRRLVRAEVLSTKVKEKFTAETPAQVPQAKIEVVRTDNEPDARTAIARISAGEEWAVVARELSDEVDAATTGGVKDFGPQGSFSEAYDEFAFASNIGQISDPLTDDNGNFFVVRVIERQARDLTELQRPQYVQTLYENWLVTMQTNLGVERHWDIDDQTDALISVIRAAPDPAPPVQQPTVSIDVPTVDPNAPTVDPNAPTVDPAAQPTVGAAVPTGASGEPSVPQAPVAPSDGQ